MIQVVHHFLVESFAKTKIFCENENFRENFRKRKIFAK
jgi:hypothetical protein